MWGEKDNIHLNFKSSNFKLTPQQEDLLITSAQLIFSCGLGQWKAFGYPKTKRFVRVQDRIPSSLYFQDPLEKSTIWPSKVLFGITGVSPWKKGEHWDNGQSTAYIRTFLPPGKLGAYVTTGQINEIWVKSERVKEIKVKEIKTP